MISGTFVANGGEKYAVLGNFLANGAVDSVLINPAHLPAVFTDACFDDVSCIEMELPAYAGKDTAVMWGDSAFLGREPDVGIDEACQWYQLPNDSVPIDTVAGLWVKPAQTSTYVVRQQLWCSGVKWDTVVVYVGFVGMDGGLSPPKFSIAPNPTSDGLIIGGTGSEPFSITVTDVTGKMIHEQVVTSQNTEWKLPIPWPEGLYFVRITTRQGMVTRKVVVQR